MNFDTIKTGAKPMTRRMFSRSFLCFAAALAGALGLGGCGGGQSAKVRYRVIATAEVDGRRVEGSTVMEVVYSRVKHSLIGAGGATKLYGEALILDLKGRGTVFILPVGHQEGVIGPNFYEAGIITTILGVNRGIGALDEEDYERLRNAKGRMSFFVGYRNRPTRLPAFVAFRDEKVPRTIYEVDPQHMDRSFPGVRFVGLDIEITDAPVTKVLKQRLPWLVSPFQNPGFDRDPPGRLRAAKDTPLSYKIDYDSFFGDGSR